MLHSLLRAFVLVAALTAFSAGADARGGGGHGGGHSGGAKLYSGTGSNSRSHSVKGYTTKKGTHVAPHHATNPNGTKRDNYEAKGNVNPHNGAVGTKLVDR